MTPLRKSQGRRDSPNAIYGKSSGAFYAPLTMVLTMLPLPSPGRTSGLVTGYYPCLINQPECPRAWQLGGKPPLTARRFSPDYFARLNTNSNVSPAGVRGFVTFNSSSVIDVTIRR